MNLRRSSVSVVEYNYIFAMSLWVMPTTRNSTQNGAHGTRMLLHDCWTRNASNKSKFSSLYQRPVCVWLVVTVVEASLWTDFDKRWTTMSIDIRLQSTASENRHHFWTVIFKNFLKAAQRSVWKLYHHIYSLLSTLFLSFTPLQSMLWDHHKPKTKICNFICRKSTKLKLKLNKNQ